MPWFFRWLAVGACLWAGVTGAAASMLPAPDDILVDDTSPDPKPLAALRRQLMVNNYDYITSKEDDLPPLPAAPGVVDQARGAGTEEGAKRRMHLNNSDHYEIEHHQSTPFTQETSTGVAVASTSDHRIKRIDLFFYLDDAQLVSASPVTSRDSPSSETHPPF